MSHFSFTRNLYDDCSLEKKNQESIGPFNWVTDKSVVESKQSCFEGTSPFAHNPFKSIPMSSVDIESDLRGQKVKLSKCPIHKYNPNNQKPYENVLNNCTSNALVPEYTRLNKACNIFSGITINRFNPLFENPNDINKIHSNSYIGENSRLLVKDAFKNNKI
jgi:hypothetical protein